MTSSPGPIPSASSVRCKPPVALFTTTECFASAISATRFPSSNVRGPVVIQPDSSAWRTSSRSRAPMSGTEMGRNSERTGRPPCEASGPVAEGGEGSFTRAV